jgi:hypothetical protein
VTKKITRYRSFVFSPNERSAECEMQDHPAMQRSDFGVGVGESKDLYQGLK